MFVLKFFLRVKTAHKNKLSLFTYSMVTTQEKRAFIKYNSEKKESIKNKLLISMVKSNTIFTFFFCTIM